MGAVTPNASLEIEFRFRVGYALHIDSSMIRCSYDNSTCYKAKALGRIDSISASDGYNSGSQLIKVSGYGFNTDADNITTLIDGAPCKTQSTNINYFTCITSPNGSPSTDTFYVGQHGLRRRLMNVSYYMDYTALLNAPYVESLAMELEGPRNIKDGSYG
jgi:hypothetical protein